MKMKAYVLGKSRNISVLEGQRAHLLDPFLLYQSDSYFPSNFTAASVEPPHHSFTNGWPDFVTATVEADETLSISPEKVTPSISGSGSFKKRKLFHNDHTQPKDHKEKKKKKMINKGCEKQEDESKTTEQNNGSDKTLKTNHKDNNKTDYIHVRARRGQATDSHSLAERVRREKISERMKYLQDLVPGCTKITGKAGMLDEIINYVQSLQRQVEFLSMKLAAVNPRLDFNVDGILTKQIDHVPIPMNNFQNVVISSQQMLNSASDPISYFNIGQTQANSMWVSDLQNIYSNIGV